MIKRNNYIVNYFDIIIIITRFIEGFCKINIDDNIDIYNNNNIDINNNIDVYVI